MFQSILAAAQRLDQQKLLGSQYVSAATTTFMNNIAERLGFHLDKAHATAFYKLFDMVRLKLTPPKSGSSLPGECTLLRTDKGEEEFEAHLSFISHMIWAELRVHSIDSGAPKGIPEETSLKKALWDFVQEFINQGGLVSPKV